jgi:hypothetical protein
MEVQNTELITYTMDCVMHLYIHWYRCLASSSDVLMQVHHSDADSLIKPPASACKLEEGLSALGISE